MTARLARAGCRLYTRRDVRVRATESHARRRLPRHAHDRARGLRGPAADRRGGALAYVALTFWLFTISVALGIVPVALAALALAWLARRDQRARGDRQRETE